MDKIVLKNIDEIIYHEELSNGLNVYVYPTTLTTSYNIGILVKVGSNVNKFNLDGKEISVPNGLEHFLEHLTLKTKDGEADDFFSNNGSYSNASTSFNSTYYYVTSTDNFDDNLEYLVNCIDTPYYTCENVENEKGIIIEEVSMYDQNPYQQLAYKLLENVFHNDNNKNKIGGTVSDVKSISLDDVVNTYNAFYQKDNMALIVTGNVDAEHTFSLIKNIEKDKQFNKKKVSIINEAENDSVVKENDIIYDNVVIPKFSLGIKIPMSKIKLSKEKTILCLYIILSVLFGRTSNLKVTLEKENLISDEIDYSIFKGFNHYVLEIDFEGNNLDKVCSLVKRTINNETITEEDLKRKKKVLIRHLISRYENINNVSNSIMASLVDYDRIIDNEYEIIESITMENINEVFDLIKASPSANVRLLPKE